MIFLEEDAHGFRTISRGLGAHSTSISRPVLSSQLPTSQLPLPDSDISLTQSMQAPQLTRSLQSTQALQLLQSRDQDNFKSLNSCGTMDPTCWPYERIPSYVPDQSVLGYLPSPGHERTYEMPQTSAQLTTPMRPLGYRSDTAVALMQRQQSQRQAGSVILPFTDYSDSDPMTCSGWIP